MQNSNHDNEKYYYEQDKKNIQKMREVLTTLPHFCKQYFRGIEEFTSARTRLGYAYDLRTFFEFLHDQNSVCSKTEITEYIESAYNRYRVIELTQDVLLQASALRGRYAFSFWDSLIIASALAANVSIVFSEDMQNQLLVESRLRIVNPFE